MSNWRTFIGCGAVLAGLALGARFAIAEPAASQAASASAPASAASAPAASLLPPEEPPPLGESPVGEQRAIDNPYTALLRVVLVLAGVILLAYLVLQKGLGSLTNRLTKGRLLRVVDRIGLEPKKSLYVIEVAGRYYLVGTTDHGVSCLATLGEVDNPPAAFDEILRGKSAPSTPGATADSPAPGARPAQGGDHG